MALRKLKIPRYYQTIKGVKTEVVEQRFADVEWEEVEVNKEGLGRAYIEGAATVSYNSTISGGVSNAIPVFYNGTAWVAH